MRLLNRRVDFLSAAFLLLILILSSYNSNSARATGLFFTRTWGGLGDDQANGVAVDSAGYFYVTGYTTSFGAGNSDIVLLEFDHTGNLSFQETWGGSGADVGNAIAVDPTGAIYVAGYTTSFGNGSSDALLLKFNSHGGLLWARTWGSANADQAYGLGLDGLGNIYVAGVYNATVLHSGGDAFILKMNSTGSLLWQASWGGRYEEQANSLTVNSSGSIYVAGWTDSFDVKNQGQETLEYCSVEPCTDNFLLKLNSTGNLQAQRIWRIVGPGVQGDAATNLVTDSSGNLYVVGDTCTTNCTNSDLTVSKLNSTGALLWEKAWHQPLAPHQEYASALSADAVGDMYVSGYGQGDVLLLKLDSQGQLLTGESWGGSGEDSGEALTLDSSGIPVVAGYVGPPSYRLQSLNLPMINTIANATTPITTLHTLNNSLTPANAPILQVTGKTTHAGGEDLFINYGFSFTASVSVFSEAGILVFAGVITLLTRKLQKRRLSRLSDRP